MKRILLLLGFSLLLGACQSLAPRDILSTSPATLQPALTPGLSPAAPLETAPPAPAVAAVQTWTATPNSCYPCGRVAATMTARIPATQTMQALETIQTRSAPAAQALLTANAASRCSPAQPVCDLVGHFFMQRPIPAANNATIDRTYAYGSTQQGSREPHHGVEFPNAQGTPVLAVADGIVVFAGDDENTLLAWDRNVYGNVVVIYHRFSAADEPVFSLYAHLYSIEVVPGQQVGTGQEIGEVGATGAAIGSHLHFEVRFGKNDYRSNRNPELWLAPPAGTGVLAGRIQGPAGQSVDGLVNVQKIEQGQVNPFPAAGLETYVTTETQPVNSDDIWQENFAAGLPAGDYRLSLLYHGELYEQFVTIRPGRLTFVKFLVK